MTRDPWDLAVAVAIAFLLGWLATACGPAVCPVAATRCAADAERVEVCDGRGQWRLAADCAELSAHDGRRWYCQRTNEDGTDTAACLPAETP